jgi:hypothetical protein
MTSTQRCWNLPKLTKLICQSILLNFFFSFADMNLVLTFIKGEIEIFKVWHMPFLSCGRKVWSQRLLSSLVSRIRTMNWWLWNWRFVICNFLFVASFLWN